MWDVQQALGQSPAEEYMKTRNGLNPDYADFDEIDEDVTDLIDGWYNGQVTPEELRAVLGREAALAYLEEANVDGQCWGIFDDPEDILPEEF